MAECNPPRRKRWGFHLPDSPNWSEDQLSELDAYASTVIEQADKAVESLATHYRITGADYALRGMEYWDRVRKGLKWFRGQLRNIRRYRADAARQDGADKEG